MCGTSQDGLDLADVSFTFHRASGWSYNLHFGQTYPLPLALKSRLSDAKEASALELAKLDVAFGTFSAEIVKAYVQKTSSTASFIGSHGVTVFHQPDAGFSTQIGSGAVIAALTGLQTVSNFRQQDVSKGGQGAPLVPSCDVHLFSGYARTLNLGGFANVSILDGVIRGFDIGPCNLLLNHLANERGLAYDENGDLARSGSVDSTFLNALNALPYYQGKPASLGAEWVLSAVVPTISEFGFLPLPDRLCTVSHHIAQQISKHLRDAKNVLVTGGGAHNAFLVDLIRLESGCEVVVPSAELIDMKEAICFAFLGLKRLLGKTNIYGSSTGSKLDSCAGALYLP